MLTLWEERMIVMASYKLRMDSTQTTKKGSAEISSKKTALSISAIGAFIGGICCFSPLVLFLVGASSASVASSLSDTLYYGYKWWFRLAGVLFLVLAFFVWYRKQSKTCAIDEKSRLRKRMLNLFLLSLTVFIILYAVWLYVIVEYVGIWSGAWELPKNIGFKTFL